MKKSLVLLAGICLVGLTGCDILKPYRVPDQENNLNNRWPTPLDVCYNIRENHKKV